MNNKKNVNREKARKTFIDEADIVSTLKPWNKTKKKLN